jgi:hypothetical protein
MMNWEQIFYSLTREERQEVARLLLQRIEHPRRLRLRELRPIHVFYPAVLAQVVWFVIIMARSAGNYFGMFITGNLVITALAILPSVFVRQRPVVHWVR